MFVIRSHKHFAIFWLCVDEDYGGAIALSLGLLHLYNHDVNWSKRLLHFDKRIFKCVQASQDPSATDQPYAYRASQLKVQHQTKIRSHIMLEFGLINLHYICRHEKPRKVRPLFGRSSLHDWFFWMLSTDGCHQFIFFSVYRTYANSIMNQTTPPNYMDLLKGILGINL